MVEKEEGIVVTEITQYFFEVFEADLIKYILAFFWSRKRNT